ncbi:MULTISPECIES: efflux RND transporter permease subunit [unclassified Vibrio]|uniref:efflux RND transporter permease subunit n=1 Tax=unclassified Vibrio TaxID=2614977 RepID=UPI0012683B68|nr:MULTISPECIES: efflux RND transporter permease subunit [unclassified Vibrio]QFT36735.1 Multidrug resistance protein MexB [Vibrio sp. THAF64]QGM34636.1 Multidrug resistance protein MexB [Vibrio sp. THAF191d]QGN70138.1 Multidrug resistance protein MexB [Vibrio sp. THAF191c]
MEHQSKTPKGLIAWFAQNPVAANLLMLGVIIVGLFSVNSLRKEAFPSLEPDIVTVSVNYDSGDPIQAEEGISIKIEEALETVAGIKRITSTSSASGSHVSIEKETNYSLDALLTDVKTKVDAINNLPAEADNPVIDKARMQDHALWVQLYGDADRATLQDLAEQLKADLLAESAIRDLEIKAEIDPMISVEVNESRLQAYGLTLTDVSDAINAESSTSISTSLRNDEKTVRLKVSEQAYEIEDFKAIPVLTHSDGSQITLGDIALVTDTFEEDTFSLSRYNQSNAMGIQIVMDEYSDVVQIVEQAKQVVEQWRSSNLLPDNVSVETWYDKSTLIKERLSLLAKNALTGIALVFIVLALFLNIRVAFWVAASLPFVFFGTLFFMTDSFVGLTINEMTTFGFIMALGIVVDDAVVVGESIYSTRRKEGDSLNSTIVGTLKVAAPTVFGVLTTVVAFLSIAAVDGKMGQIYAQFATVVTICLLLSLVESKFILPSHLAHINTHRSDKKGIWNRIQQGADNGLEWFNHKVYKQVIKQALKFRYAVFMAFIALFILVIGMPLTGAVRIAFFPDIAGDTVSAEISMYNDSSFGQTQTNLLELEANALKADQQLRASSESSDQKTSYITSLQVIADEDRTGTVQVELSTDATYSSGEFADLWLQMSGQMEGMKKLKVLSSMEMVDNFKVELKASDDTILTQAGNTFKQALEQTPGVSGIDDNLDLGEPQYRFELTEQGRALGMDTSSLAKQVLQSFGGDIVQRFQRGKDEVKVRVRYPEGDRQTLADIQQSSVRTSDGKVVPMLSVANVYSDYQQAEITRIDNLRAVYLTAVVDKDVVSSNELVAQLEKTLVPQLKSEYPTLKIDFTGEAEQQQESTDSMQSTFIMALVVIFALLAIPLKSYVQPLIIMVAIPFGIVGAILGHWLNDLTISILSLNGILALSGVVVNDSLLLVSRFNELTRKHNVPVSEAIVESCSSRLRAVLLTSVTTFAGLAPLLSETSMQAQFLIPAAAALGYGILFATMITLVLTPSLLLIQCDIHNGLNKVKAAVLGEKKLAQSV